MDKNTLSNYGWIVIAVLVLAVVIALAIPFGEYIKAGDESTPADLFDTSEAGDESTPADLFDTSEAGDESTPADLFDTSEAGDESTPADLFDTSETALNGVGMSESEKNPNDSKFINVRDQYKHETGYVDDKGLISTDYDSNYIRIPVNEGERWCIWFESSKYLMRRYGALRYEDAQNEIVNYVELHREKQKYKANSTSDVLGAVVEIPAGVSYMCVNLRINSPDKNFDNSKTAIIGQIPKTNNIKLVAIGDSITEKNYTASKNWVDLLAETQGYYCVNLGHSGYGYNGVDGDFSEHFAEIPDDADLIVFYGSFNDRSGEVGTKNDVYVDGSENTLAACMNYAYDYIKTNYPQAKIAVIAPAPWSIYNPVDTTSKASQYVSVMKEICQDNEIPFLDLFHNSGMTPWDEEYKNQYYYNSDGIHPTNEGHQILASKIAPFIQSVLND